MIRILGASLLFASCNAVAQTSVPNDLTDGEVASAEEVMQNFQALESAIDTKAPPTNCSIEQIIKWNGSLWVCADPADAVAVGGFAFIYEFQLDTGEGHFASKDSGEQVSFKSVVDALWLSNITYREMSVANFLNGVESGDWISVRALSDPTDMTVFQVNSTPVFSVTDFRLSVDPGATFVSGPSVFYYGKKYVIDFNR